MTHDYSRLHRAVDRLDPEQAKAVLEMLKSMLGEQIVAETTSPAQREATGSNQHRFSVS